MPTIQAARDNASKAARPEAGAGAAAGEAAAWAVGAAALIYRLRVPLFSGTSTFRHDNINFVFPVFRHFVDGFSHGLIPLWNPYSAGGQPFFPLPAHVRLLDPVSMAAVAAASLFTRDTVVLFNWMRVAQSLVMAAGAYLTLRRFCREWPLRLCLIPPLLFSSFMLGSFQQDGRLEQLLWVPWMMHFLLKIAYHGEDGWPSWLLLAVTTGLNWLCYFFAGVWMFFGIFAAGLLLFRRDLLSRLRQRTSPSKIAVFVAAQALMIAPALGIYRLSSDYVFPLRMLDLARRNGPALGGPQPNEGGPGAALPSLFLDYGQVRRMGSFAAPADFLQIPWPGSPAEPLWPASSSEAFIYLGLSTWALALLGVLMGSDGLKRVWLLTAAVTAFVMLGPAGGVHRVLFALFPPLWLVRHTHLFVGFFELCLLYFFVLGLNVAAESLG